MSDLVSPPDPTSLTLALAGVGAFFAAAVNAVAGGGTLISFPVLIALGLPPVTANATSTVGIWPGSLGSVWGFRGELRSTEPRLLRLAVPGFIGGAVGAWLLRTTSERTFTQVVPFLVLFATVLFAVRGRLQAWLAGRTTRAGAPGGGHAFAGHGPLGPALVLAVGVYGGYFGAGMSIMNLAVLGVLGLTDLLAMNAITSLLALCVNGVAIALFAQAGLVQWPVAGAMAVGALAGGYGAVSAARRVGREALGRFVVGVGFAVSAVFFWRSFFGSA